MKKIYLLICISSIAFNSFAQWTVLSSGVTNTLRAPYFFNSNTGFVVGEGIAPLQSPILKTTNGGTSWTNIVSGTTQALRDVHFTTPDNGIIVGFTGTILKSTDGGDTWNPIASGTVQHLRSIAFPSNDTGYIAGGKGVLLKTIDGGSTWTTLNSGIDSDLISIRFTDNYIGYAVSCGSNLANFNKGKVLKTTDGGATWNILYTNENDGFLGLAAPNSNTAYAGGHNDLIVKTSDGGNTWNIIDSGTVAHNIRSAFFVSADKGWMGCDQGDIYYTEDGGTSWTNQTVNLNGVYGLYFSSPDSGYAVGAAGSILKYAAACQPFTAIGSIEGVTTACAGDTVTYTIPTVIGANNYSWSVPEEATIISGQGETQVTVVLSETSGTVTVQAESACDSISTGLELTVNAAPPVPTITFANSILTSSAPSDNQWYFNGAPITGATNSTYTPTQDGVYSVTVTNSDGCSSSSSPLTVLGTGINVITSQAGVVVYPNPFHSFTTLSFPANMYISHGAVIISNVEGSIVRTITDVNGSSVIISRGMLSPGFYYYRLLDGTNNIVATGKLVAE